MSTGSEPLSIADSKTYLPYIDGLRGIAVLMVLAVHTSQRVGNIAPGSFHFSIVEELINAGARGVELFFLLSAFTLFRSSKVKYDEELNPRRNFYIRRAFRILPMWWSAITLYTLFGGGTFGASIPSYLMYFGFIRFLPGVDVFPLGWTIFVEETFYLFLPLIFGFIANIRRAGLFFILALALSIIWKELTYHFDISNQNAFVELFPLNHWYGFALGILLFYAQDNEFVKHRILQNSRSWRILDVLTVFVLFFVVRESRAAASFGLALFFLVTSSEYTILGKMCRLKLLKYFGVCCYSIYLLHFFVLDSTDGLKQQLLDFLGLGDASVEIRFLIWFPIVALINLMLGMLLFRYLEKPCVQLSKKVIHTLEMRRLATIQDQP